MLMDWQNKYGKNGHPTKGNLHVQCNPNQNPNTILQRHGKSNTQINLETLQKQKTNKKQNRENNT